MSKTRRTHAVSVLVDTYNHEKFIEQAITSVFAQDFSGAQMQVLVIDDGSTDRTPDIVRKFEPRLRLIRKNNGGQASAFNVGIPEATGEFVAFLDGDDWWMPNKLRRVVEAFERSPALGFVGHGIFMTYDDGRQMSHALRKDAMFRLTTREDALLFRSRKSFMGTSRMAVRADVLRQILPVPGILTFEADEYISTLAAALSEIQILAEPLTFYRIHEGNAFQVANPDPQRMKRKSEVLAALARVLRTKLTALGVDKGTIEIVLEWVQTESDQIRLALGDGWSWETVLTEWRAHHIVHPGDSLSRQFFKLLTLLPAAVLPPRTYYGLRNRVATNELYRNLRDRWLPHPKQPHVQNSWANAVTSSGAGASDKQ